MNKSYVFLLLIFTLSSLKAQEIVNLPISVSDDAIEWKGGEKDFHSKIWDTRVVTNVSKATMEVFRPEKPNGAALVVCPGGALYAHSIDSEGNWVAKALNEMGITVFVLKYRLVPTGEDGTMEAMSDGMKVLEKAKSVLPLAVSDGLNAIDHVRTNAVSYNVDPNRIGIMGFSAGGAVTMGVTYSASESTRPNFLVPVYFWEDAQPIQDVPVDAGPAFILCATDDPLGLAPASAELYLSWIRAGKKAELHMYSQGGHGFGMRPMDLPVSQWTKRFGEWMTAEGLMSGAK